MQQEEGHHAEKAGRGAVGPQRLLLGLCALVSIAFLGQSLFFSRYGFDVTDETFYLFWVANPRAWSVHIPATLFGFVYHPLFLLVSGDVAALRQANVLLSFGLAFLLCWGVLGEYWFRSRRDALGLVALSLAFACLSLISFNAWLLTPSYNTLAFQSLALATLGLLHCSRDEQHSAWTGVLLVAVGGWIAFLAKPSTAAALAVAMFLYGCVLGRKCLGRIIIAGVLALGLLLVSALAIDGSVTRFATRLGDSIQLLRLLGSGQDFSKIFRIDSFTLSGRDYLIAVSILLAVPIFEALISRTRRARGVLIALGLVLGACALLVGLGQVKRYPAMTAVVFFVVAVSLVGAFVLACPRDMVNGMSRRQVAFGLFLLLVPHIYSFGTNGNYWANDRDASLFWVLSAIVLVSPVAARERGRLWLVLVALGVQLLVSLVIDQTLTQPYRQPHSLRQNTKAVDIHGTGSLVVADGFHAYFSDAQRVAKDAGFSAGMPMIDLSGQSPGILYLLGARSLGQPWMVGAYPGSNRLAVATLAREDCKDVASAWLLDEPGGPRSLSVGPVLQAAAGADRGDYEVVGSFVTAEYAGGYPERRKQYLLKPKRPAAAAVAACESARKQMTEGGRR